RPSGRSPVFSPSHPECRMLSARSRFRVVVLLGILTGCTGNSGTITGPDPITPRERAFLDTLSQRTFAFFWERSDPSTGLTPDRWPTLSFSSVAAIGFALTA